MPSLSDFNEMRHRAELRDEEVRETLRNILVEMRRLNKLLETHFQIQDKTGE